MSMSTRSYAIIIYRDILNTYSNEIIFYRHNIIHRHDAIVIHTGITVSGTIVTHRQGLECLGFGAYRSRLSNSCLPPQLHLAHEVRTDLRIESVRTYVLDEHSILRRRERKKK